MISAYVQAAPHYRSRKMMNLTLEEQEIYMFDITFTAPAVLGSRNRMTMTN